MSAVKQNRGSKIAAASNLYTAILALAVGIVSATAAFVAYMCYIQYGTIWKIP
ncbi:MAG: hypothetical protein ACYS8I_06360 [Planctomycetota bacterium]|jgi:hypothetical protein